MIQIKKKLTGYRLEIEEDKAIVAEVSKESSSAKVSTDAKVVMDKSEGQREKVSKTSKEEGEKTEVKVEEKKKEKKVEKVKVETKKEEPKEKKDEVPEIPKA